VRLVRPVVEVVGGNLESALRHLKKAVEREGVAASMRRHQHHEKAGDRRRREHREAVRRRKKALKRSERTEVELEG